MTPDPTLSFPQDEGEYYKQNIRKEATAYDINVFHTRVWYKKAKAK